MVPILLLCPSEAGREPCANEPVLGNKSEERAAEPEQLVPKLHCVSRTPGALAKKNPIYIRGRTQESVFIGFLENSHIGPPEKHQ